MSAGRSTGPGQRKTGELLFLLVIVVDSDALLFRRLAHALVGSEALVRGRAFAWAIFSVVANGPGFLLAQSVSLPCPSIHRESNGRDRGGKRLASRQMRSNDGAA